jgi:hypothetical protein
MHSPFKEILIIIFVIQSVISLCDGEDLNTGSQCYEVPKDQIKGNLIEKCLFCPRGYGSNLDPIDYEIFLEKEVKDKDFLLEIKAPNNNTYIDVANLKSTGKSGEPLKFTLIIQKSWTKRHGIFFGNIINKLMIKNEPEKYALFYGPNIEFNVENINKTSDPISQELIYAARVICDQKYHKIQKFYLLYGEKGGKEEDYISTCESQYEEENNKPGMSYECPTHLDYNESKGYDMKIRFEVFKSNKR